MRLGDCREGWNPSGQRIECVIPRGQDVFVCGHFTSLGWVNSGIMTVSSDVKHRGFCGQCYLGGWPSKRKCGRRGGDHGGLECWEWGKWEVGRACWERGELGLGAPGACLERAGRRTPCAGRAVILPAVQSLRRAGSEGAGRRTPCAGRAVILTAVQSLRRAGWERLRPGRNRLVR